VLGQGEAALAARGSTSERPKATPDHSKRPAKARACDDSPLAELDLVSIAGGTAARVH
jgi:hypothetical protein